jgi:EAL domain-containing protein (putative c-di-GMP-specific phosphodiesterase class I)
VANTLSVSFISGNNPRCCKLDKKRLMETKQNIYDTNFIGQSTRKLDGKSSGIFKDLTLNSAYQPIFSLAHKRIVGYEALIRAQNNKGLPIRPDDLFRLNENISDIVLLDRICRFIHVDNFQNFNDNINWLFLNVSPQTVIHGRKFGTFFSDLIEKFHLHSYRIVIEIVEHPIPGEDNSLLLETVEYYKNLGCLIAIDDFGAGYSNFDRIWTLKPDIVKLDRAMLTRASTDNSIRQLFSGIVSLLHQAGSLVVIEGVETEEQAFIAMESDADMVQGYFFARPHQDLKEISPPQHLFQSLFETYKASETLRTQNWHTTFSKYRDLFISAVELLKEGFNLRDSCKSLFENEAIVRAYLLEPGGVQIGDTVVSPLYSEKADFRFKPLEEAKNADWFRRHYMRRAVMMPGQLQKTRPYLSITGAHMCSTLSMLIHTPSGAAILCCDLTLE